MTWYGLRIHLVKITSGHIVNPHTQLRIDWVINYGNDTRVAPILAFSIHCRSASHLLLPSSSSLKFSLFLSLSKKKEPVNMQKLFTARSTCAAIVRNQRKFASFSTALLFDDTQIQVLSLYMYICMN